MDIDPTALIAPGYYAGMGYGVPAGLGLQAATGSRPLILVGDGAFQMTGWELGNAQRYGWDPVVLVFNNASWEMLRAFEPDAGFNDLGTWDFASMAAGMGGDGHLVRTCGELERALDKPGPRAAASSCSISASRRARVRPPSAASCRRSSGCRALARPATTARTAAALRRPSSAR